MNFNELRELVSHLKKVTPCSSCKKKFTNNNIHVIATAKDEAIFHFNCKHCENMLLVHVTISEQTKESSKLSIHATSSGPISENDVLDIHNFLNGFKGDFKQLFSIENH